MKQNMIMAVVAVLVTGTTLVAPAPTTMAAPKGKPHSDVVLRVSPAEVTASELPCLPGSVDVTLANVGTEPMFAEATLDAEAPITLSDTIFASYLPASDPIQPVSKTFDIRVPRGTAPGTYDITVTTGKRGHRQTDVVPVTVVPVPQRTPEANLAFGEQAIASSTHGNFSVCGPVDGDREDAHWEQTGWNDGTREVFPDWYGVQWQQAVTVDRVELWTKAPAASHGVRDFDVQVRDGDAWRTVAQVTGNDQAHVVTEFPAQHTDAVRVLIHAAGTNYSRLLEFEVYGS